MEKYLDASDVMWPIISIGGIPVKNTATVSDEVKLLTQDLLVYSNDPSQEQCTVNPNSMAYFFQSKK